MSTEVVGGPESEDDDWRVFAATEWERRIGEHFVKCYSWLPEGNAQLREWPGTLRQFSDWLAEAYPEKAYAPVAAAYSEKIQSLSFLIDGQRRRRYSGHGELGLVRIMAPLTHAAWELLRHLMLTPRFRHPRFYYPTTYGLSTAEAEVLGSIHFGIHVAVEARRASETRAVAKLIGK